jgi:hypothetical protein
MAVTLRWLIREVFVGPALFSPLFLAPDWIVNLLFILNFLKIIGHSGDHAVVKNISENGSVIHVMLFVDYND